MSQATSAELHTDPTQFPGLDVYAVAGNPISHSKSPAIHKRFAEQSNQKMHYGRLQPALDQFKTAAQAFFAAGGKGMNVTVPFKLDAQALADVLTPRAQLAGAVNTLCIQDGKIFGDNTDGAGLVRDLLAQGIQIKGSRILLLGAGGASRGVLGPLLEHSPKELMIANRSNVKADELIHLFGSLASSVGVALQAVSLSDLEDAVKTTSPFDLIINATAAGLSDASPISDAAASNIFTPRSFAYDMVYGKATAFMQQALHRGARVSDGLGMLVEQAADAFLIWRGPELADAIDPRAVLAELRTS
ncbi:MULTISPECIES: shikimate dehydrogenase [unclassified Polynucleobacter]|uniref:shikimate dehydrogenase n=1 Tax=unclassified Polynucleobacter TaxID=2640945 RepID=UPI0008B7CF96|nr:MULTISPECIES: shikimate dehydrogenase [unclassified Polynucleobacter]OHC09668.1 MAG: shikimate dehydrogenase [Polynucleobacter sp. GWA2_45_21]HBK43762.1 shikimate dehydrogenase [Polynucleobacter sp.]